MASITPSATSPAIRKTAPPRAATNIGISGRAEKPSRPLSRPITFPFSVTVSPCHIPRMISMASRMAVAGFVRAIPMAGNPEPPAPIATKTLPPEISSSVAMAVAVRAG